VALRIPNPGLKSLIPIPSHKNLSSPAFFLSRLPPHFFTARQLIEMRTADLIVRSPQPFLNVIPGHRHYYSCEVIDGSEGRTGSRLHRMSSVPPVRYVKNKSPVARIPKTRSAVGAPEENVVTRIIPGYRAGYSRYDAWLYVCSYRSGRRVCNFLFSLSDLTIAVASGCILHILPNLKKLSTNLCVANPRTDNTRFFFVPGRGPWVRGGYPC